MSRGTSKSCEKSHSLEPSASSVRLSENNLRSQHETIYKIPMERWLHGNPLECPWTLIPLALEVSNEDNDLTPCLPPRLAEQPISGGNGGGDSPHCARCNAGVYIKDIFVEKCRKLTYSSLSECLCLMTLHHFAMCALSVLCSPNNVRLL